MAVGAAIQLRAPVVIGPTEDELHRELVAVAERDATTVVGAKLRILDLQPPVVVLFNLVSARALRLVGAGAELLDRLCGDRVADPRLDVRLYLQVSPRF